MTRFWPFPINWRDSLICVDTFRTQIIVSRDKTEQRIALLDEPRRTFSFLVTVHADKYRKLMREMVQGAARDWWVRDPTTSVPVVSGVLSGGDTITPILLAPWMTIGRKVVLSMRDRSELFTISAVGVDLTFVETFTSDWPASTRVSLAQNAWIEVGSESDIFTDNVAEMKLTFAVVPGSGPVEIPEPALTVFNSREVFLKKPNWGNTLEGVFNAFREPVDYGKGRIANFVMADFLPIGRQSTYLSRNREELNSMRQFFLRQSGQQGEFYMPTWTQDIIPASNLAAAGNTLVVGGTELYDAYHDDPAYHAVILFLVGGAVLIRLISGMGINMGNSVLTMTQSWGSNISQAEIRMVCWLPLWRLASDALTIEWLTGQVGQTVLSMRMMKDQGVAP